MHRLDETVKDVQLADGEWRRVMPGTAFAFDVEVYDDLWPALMFADTAKRPVVVFLAAITAFRAGSRHGHRRPACPLHHPPHHDGFRPRRHPERTSP